MQRSFLPSINNEACPNDSELYRFVASRITSLFDKPQRSIFQGSSFEDWRNLGPHGRGKIGQRLVKVLAENMGYLVGRSEPGIADLRIQQVETEVKTAMQKEDMGFLINQLRPQPYIYVVNIVVRPKNINIFTVPKDIMLSLATGQHGGIHATETFIYSARNFDALWHDLRDYSGIEVFRAAYEVVSV